jgi:uncharacterized membrane protein YfcA
VTTVAIALVAGALIGLSLGALGAGGSILAVPVLVYALDQDAAQATTGSLVVVGVTALFGVAGARHAGTVRLARGVGFGLLALGGAAAGARAATHVPDPVLLASFAVLMVLVAGVMVARLVRERRTSPPDGARHRDRPSLDDPIISLHPAFACDCPRALKLLVTATAVGLLTGFLGVGGGFLVVPALVLAVGLPLDIAAGTSLVVIALTSAAALAVRVGSGVAPDWGVVLALTVASVAGGLLGTRAAARADTRRLAQAFTAVLVAVAAWTAAQALPALL